MDPKSESKTLVTATCTGTSYGETSEQKLLRLENGGAIRLSSSFITIIIIVGVVTFTLEYDMP
jgi:hypothetical protein